MPYELDNRLVIGVASSAVFDLSESDAVFRREGRSSTANIRKRILKFRSPRASRFRLSSGCWR